MYRIGRAPVLVVAERVLATGPPEEILRALYFTPVGFSHFFLHKKKKKKKARFKASHWTGNSLRDMLDIGQGS